MLLAALPVLALPFLLGGLTWREAVTALLLNFSSVCLALAAGLIASSRCRRWNRALLLSEVLAAILLSGFGCLLTFGLHPLGAIAGGALAAAWGVRPTMFAAASGSV